MEFSGSGEEYSNKQFWDEYWKDEKRSGYEFLFSELVDRYVDWNKIKNYMEIGGAPGTIMSYMFHAHRLDVSTVDFCNPKILSELLDRNKIKDYKIYNENFVDFDTEPHLKKYDMVASWGIVEHFSLEESYNFIQKHKAMVSGNGYLIIELPNIRGFNWLLYRLMNNDLLKIHNLKTMDLSFLRQAIKGDKEFKILYGNYYLTSFLEYSSANEFFERHKVIKLIFGFFKSIFAVLHLNNIPNRLFSPYIVFIAQREEQSFGSAHYFHSNSDVKRVRLIYPAPGSRKLNNFRT